MLKAIRHAWSCYTRAVRASLRNQPVTLDEWLKRQW